MTKIQPDDRGGHKFKVTVDTGIGLYEIHGITFVQLLDLQKVIAEFVLSKVNEVQKKGVETLTWDDIQERTGSRD